MSATPPEPGWCAVHSAPSRLLSEPIVSPTGTLHGVLRPLGYTWKSVQLKTVQAYVGGNEVKMTTCRPG